LYPRPNGSLQTVCVLCFRSLVYSPHYAYDPYILSFTVLLERLPSPMKCCSFPSPGCVRSWSPDCFGIFVSWPLNTCHEAKSTRECKREGKVVVCFFLLLSIHLTSNQVRLPAELKHINKRRKRN